MPISGSIAQDKWTRNRLTLTFGGRYDYLNARRAGRNRTRRPVRAGARSASQSPACRAGRTGRSASAAPTISSATARPRIKALGRQVPRVAARWRSRENVEPDPQHDRNTHLDRSRRQRHRARSDERRGAVQRNRSDEQSRTSACRRAPTASTRRRLDRRTGKRPCRSQQRDSSRGWRSPAGFYHRVVPEPGAHPQRGDRSGADYTPYNDHRPGRCATADGGGESHHRGTTCMPAKNGAGGQRQHLFERRTRASTTASK